MGRLVDKNKSRYIDDRWTRSGQTDSIWRETETIAGLIDGVVSCRPSWMIHWRWHCLAQKNCTMIARVCIDKTDQKDERNGAAPWIWTWVCRGETKMPSRCYKVHLWIIFRRTYLDKTRMSLNWILNTRNWRLTLGISVDSESARILKCHPRQISASICENKNAVV